MGLQKDVSKRKGYIMNEDKLILQELQNLKELVKELKDTTKNQEKRIVELEASQSITDLRFNQIMDILNKLNDKTIPSLTKEIEELKNKPGKRYEQIITGILGAIFGAIGGIIAKMFLK